MENLTFNVLFLILFIMLGYNIYKGLENVKYIQPPIEENKKADVRKSADDILDLIFSVDPVTLQITSDVSQYLGEKTSPEVRNFIQQQLMRDTSQRSPLSLNSEQTEEMRNIDDDLRVELMRGEFETVEDYQDRIMSKLNDYKTEIHNRKLIADYEKRHQQTKS